MIRNPLSYPGNKNKLLKEIIPNFPDTSSFVDVFCGSGAVGVNSNSQTVYLNDINEWSIAILKILYETEFDEVARNIQERINQYGLTDSKSHPKGFYVEHKHEGLSKYNRTGFSSLKKHFNETHDIYDLITLTIYGFNHYLRFNKKGEFNVPVGKVDFSSSIYKDLKLFMSKMKTKQIVFSSIDFRNEALYKQPEAFYYFDPPYLITTAPYNTEWSKDEEIELLKLLDTLNERGFKFALSNVFLSNGKTNDLLISWATKYHVIQMKRQYRNANYQKINMTDSIEVLIINF